jgi:hypothetical protein
VLGISKLLPFPKPKTRLSQKISSHRRYSSITTTSPSDPRGTMQKSNMASYARPPSQSKRSYFINHRRPTVHHHHTTTTLPFVVPPCRLSVPPPSAPPQFTHLLQGSQQAPTGTGTGTGVAQRPGTSHSYHRLPAGLSTLQTPSQSLPHPRTFQSWHNAPLLIRARTPSKDTICGGLGAKSLIYTIAYLAYLACVPARDLLPVLSCRRRGLVGQGASNCGRSNRVGRKGVIRAGGSRSPSMCDLDDCRYPRVLGDCAVGENGEWWNKLQEMVRLEWMDMVKWDT